MISFETDATDTVAPLSRLSSMYKFSFEFFLNFFFRKLIFFHLIGSKRISRTCVDALPEFNYIIIVVKTRDRGHEQHDDGVDDDDDDVGDDDFSDVDRDYDENGVYRTKSRQQSRVEPAQVDDHAGRVVPDQVQERPVEPEPGHVR